MPAVVHPWFRPALVVASFAEKWFRPIMHETSSLHDVNTAHFHYQQARATGAPAAEIARLKSEWQAAKAAYIATRKR